VVCGKVNAPVARPGRSSHFAPASGRCLVATRASGGLRRGGGPRWGCPTARSATDRTPRCCPLGPVLQVEAHVSCAGRRQEPRFAAGRVLVLDLATARPSSCVRASDGS